MREKVEKRTSHTETWVADDGREVLRSFAARRYYDGGRGMRRIDVALKREANGRGARTTANDWVAHMPQTADEPFVFAADGEKIRMTALGARPAPIDFSGHRATYRGVWRDADLEYTLANDVAKEDIVLRTKEAPTSFRFRVEDVRLEPDPASPGALRPQGRDDGWRLSPLTVETARDTAVEATPRYDVAYDGSDTLITVGIDAAWFRSLPRSAFPVRLDPSFSRYPTWNWWALKSDGWKCTNPTQDYCWPKVGSTDWNFWRTSIRFGFDELRGKQIQGAWLRIPVSAPVAGHNIQYDALPVGAGHATCVDQFGCLNASRPRPTTSIGSDGWLNVTELYEVFQREGDWGAWLMLFGHETHSRPTYKLLDPNYMYIDFTYNTPPPVPTQLAPAPGDKTLLPAMSFRASTVADADGNPVTYRFSVVSASGLRGQVSESGWLSTPTWSVPDAVLEDGGRYTWTVCANDTMATTCSGSRNFSVDSRRGKDATQTFDTLGSLEVALATGNVVTSASSHTMNAVGGSLGLGLEYSTPTLSRPGLLARYYNDTARTGVFPVTPALTRVDQNIAFNWEGRSPAPGSVDADYFLTRWEGYFLPPTTGIYSFGARGDDGMRVYINDEVTLDLWGWAGNGGWTSSLELQEGQPVPIEVEFREAGGAAAANLLVRGAVQEQSIPAQWLRTEATPVPNARGLSGAYYRDVNTNGVIDAPDGPPFLVRDDQHVSFDWPAEPVPGAPADRFMVRWTGRFTPPATGAYAFGAAVDDTITLRVNGTTLLTSGCCPQPAAPSWSSGTVSLTAGVSVPIQIDYAETGGPGHVRLFTRASGVVAEQAVQPAWLTPRADVLPDGWRLSIDPDGDLAYESLRLTSSNALLVAPTGATVEYMWTGSGYRPTGDEQGVLTGNPDGTFSLHDVDGRVYLFGTDGSLTSVTSPLDDRKPAALRYIYGGTPSRLLRIEDGVDPARRAVLHYSSGADGQADCAPAPDGFDAPPSNFLCAVVTSDGRRTELFYKLGRLARLEQPGKAITDWGYDDTGRITSTRDPLLNDALLAGVTGESEAARAVLAYDPVGRADVVRLQQPAPGAMAPEHTYDYLNGSSLVHLTGTPEPRGYSRKITYDALLRTISHTDNAGLVSHTTWHANKDLITATTDPLGLRTTTVYDDLDRPVDRYGPAPADWFGTPPEQTPQKRTAEIPRSSTEYDGGIHGLAAAYFGNKDLIRAPLLHGTGVGGSSGDVNATWGSSPPVTPGSSYPGTTGWGVRLSGHIQLPVTGTIGFRALADDAVRLFVDDVLVLNGWTSTLTAPRSVTGSFAATRTGLHRIRLEYADLGGTDSRLHLFRTLPGQPETSALGSSLSPGYGLTTRTTAHDLQAGSLSTATGFDRPETGLATTSTLDPDGLALTTRTEYEAPGAGFLRRTTRTLPAGNTYRYEHYEATQAMDNPCTSAIDPASQGGLPRLTTDPDPDAAGPQTGIRRESVYDASGRVAASRIADGSWNCTVYDARSRVTRVDIAATPDAPGRTVTSDFAVEGSPLTTSTTDPAGTIQTVTDLLGRVVSYSDALGNTTGTSYDRNGLVISRTGTLGTERFVYDDYRRPVEQYLDGALLAKTTYDAYSRVASVDYPTREAVPGGTFDDVITADTPAARWPVVGSELPTLRDVVSDARGVAGPGASAVPGHLTGGGDALGLNVPGAPRPVPAIATSARFTGDGAHIRRAHDAPQNALPLTAEAWVTTTQTTGPRQIVGKWVDGGTNGWRVAVVNGRIRGVYANAKNRGIGLSAGGIDGGFIADGKPHHVAFVVNTSGGEIYVDGVRRITAPWAGRPGASTATTELRVGLTSFSKTPTATQISASAFAGNLDDVLVHKRALPASELNSRATSPPVADTNTLLWWRLDEAAGTTIGDSSASNRPGTVAGAVRLQAPQVTPHGFSPLRGGGTAVELNGTDGTVSVPSMPAMTALPMTVEGWVSTGQVDATARTLVGKQTAAGEGWALTLQNGEILPSWTTSAGRIHAASAGLIADGRPHHVAWTVTSTGSVLYLDGRPQLTQSWTATPAATTGTDPLRIGRTAVTTPVFTAMSVDQVSIHSSALSAADVARRAVYPQSEPLPTVTELPLDETSGAIAINSAQGAAPGAFSGGVRLARPALAPDPRDVAHLSAGAVSAPYTVEAWFRTAGTGPMTVLSPLGGQGLTLELNASSVAARIPSADGPILATAPAAVQDGRVHQVAVVVSESAWSLVVDGSVVGSGRLAAPLQARTSNDGLRLGGADVGRPFVGWVEDLTLYSSTLDTSRLRAHWSKSVHGQQQPPEVINRLSFVGYDDLARMTELRWTLADGSTSSHAVDRSASGRIIDERIDGADANPSAPNYAYDGAGRLVRAHVRGHVLQYGFGDTTSCSLGAAVTAGRNSNRTSLVDNGVTTTYCYDSADRLLSSTDPEVTSPRYDVRGNTVALGTGDTPLEFGFDSADRHLETRQAGSTVTLARDAEGRITQRVAEGETTRYGYTSSADSADLVFDGSGAVAERILSLPGGALLTQARDGIQTWSLPNVHGDTLVTASDGGRRTSPTLVYDPFGQPLSGDPQNLLGGFDFGWLGKHQKMTDSAFSIKYIEMGARLYVPKIGRFLQVDPVEGGSANDYDYSNQDPVNQLDLDGQLPVFIVPAAVYGARLAWAAWKGIEAYKTYQTWKASRNTRNDRAVAAVSLFLTFTSLDKFGKPVKYLSRGRQFKTQYKALTTTMWRGTARHRARARAGWQNVREFSQHVAGKAWEGYSERWTTKR